MKFFSNDNFLSKQQLRGRRLAGVFENARAEFLS
jgi:hypothetical protein